LIGNKADETSTAGGCLYCVGLKKVGKDLEEIKNMNLKKEG